MSLANFIPEIWSAQLLVNLHNSLVYGSPTIVNRDYEGEVSAYGDTVRIHNIGGVTVSDYTPNSDFATGAETLTSGETVLTIDRSKMFNFQIDDVDAAQVNPKVMGAAMREAAFALGNDLDAYLSSTIQAAVPSGNKVSAVTDMTVDGKVYEALVDLSVVLDENNAPADGGRYVVVPPQAVGALLKDQRFISFGTDPNRATIANRHIGSVAGFNVFVSNQTPIATGVSTVLAGHTWATTLAEQVSKVEAYRPQARFSDAVKGLHVYGAKVVRPALLASVDVTL